LGGRVAIPRAVAGCSHLRCLHPPDEFIGWLATV
jgi:hypothetical protein